MEKIKILVVEDELIIADNICDIIVDLGYQALEPAISYSEAIQTIEQEKPNLALLDIQLSGKKTGIDLAKTIEEQYSFPFIFLTSNSDKATVESAKKVIPASYLLKPFTKEQIYTAIEMALHQNAKLNQPNNESAEGVSDVLFYKDKGVLKRVLYSDIMYIKSAHVYVELIVKNSKNNVVVRTGLAELLIKLPQKFVRVHRSYVVNTHCIQQIDGHVLNIEGNKIPIGQTYRAELLERISYI